MIFQIHIHFSFQSDYHSYWGATILSRINVDFVILASHNNRHNHIHNNRKWLKQPQSDFHQEIPGWKHPFFGVLMYSLYGHPNFDLEQKCQQYGPFFQTIFPFLMSIIQHIMSDANTLMLLQCLIKSWSSFKFIQTYLLGIISQVLGDLGFPR